MALDVTGRYRYPAFSEAWLSQVEAELVVDPKQKIIDAHHHLWTEGGQDYLALELLQDLRAGHDVRATVFVQASHGYRQSGPAHHRCVGETESAVAAAEFIERNGGPRACAAIVGYADLTLGEQLVAVIEDHLSAGRGRFRGVRHSVARDEHFPDGIVLRPAPPGLLFESSYRDGLRVAHSFGLSYDAMIYHAQLPELTALADWTPDLPIVLDHMGCILGVGPYRGRATETFQSWRVDIRELARRSNVSVKLGGLGMIICGADWHERPGPPSSAELAEVWRPYFVTCIEAFGASRCMFESNFPVDKSQFSYRTLWNAFKLAVRDASPSEKDALFHDTAARIYRIEPGVRAPGADG